MIAEQLFDVSDNYFRASFFPLDVLCQAVKADYDFEFVLTQEINDVIREKACIGSEAKACLFMEFCILLFKQTYGLFYELVFKKRFTPIKVKVKRAV